jgi:hypothetical protein
MYDFLLFLRFGLFFNLGDALVKVKASVSVLDDFAIKEFCSHCMKILNSDFLCCSKCPIMKYCNLDCLVIIYSVFKLIMKLE